MKKVFYFLSIFAAVLSTLVALPVSSSLAQSTPAHCDEQFYSDNNVLFYDPCDNSCSTGQVTITTSTTVPATDAVKQVYTFLTSTPLSSNGNKPLTPAQAAGAMGNMYEESGGLNPGSIEGNDGASAGQGHGIAQWSYGRWNGPNGLSAFASQQGKQWDDLTLQLAFLQHELEGPEQAILQDKDFSTTNDPSVATLRWRVVFERASATLAHDDKRVAAAIAIYTMFGGTAASCQSTGAVVSGSLVQTAINFALTSPAKDTMNQQSDARDTYQQAKLQYNPSVSWSDCGGFIATAMYASGVDKNYPNVGVSAQLNYVKSHPEKYIVNPHPVLSDLQPGDILYISGHTTMYTGAATYPMVDASLDQRVPSVRPMAALQWMLSQSDVESARLIN